MNNVLIFIFSHTLIVKLFWYLVSLVIIYSGSKKTFSDRLFLAFASYLFFIITKYEQVSVACVCMHVCMHVLGKRAED